MPRPSCQPCCQPQQFGNTKEGFQGANLQILCDILAALGGAPTDIVRYDYEVLCDPSSGDPVLLRFGYDNDGTNITVAGFNPDGSDYLGVLADLVSCGGGSGPGTDINVNQWGGVNVAAASFLTDNFVNSVVAHVGAFNMVWDGVTWDRSPGNSTDGLLVNLGANNDVTVTGTVAATQSGAWVLSANSGVDIGDVTVNNAAGASAVNIQDGGNSITVDGTVGISGTVAVTQSTSPWVVSGTVDTEFPPAAVLTDNFANPTTTSVAGMNMVWDGATWDRSPGNSTDGLLVNLGANNDVTITGTVAVTQSGTWVLGANSGVDIGDVTINNAAGASAVNIQDGGNSITVDGTVGISGTVAVTQSTSPWVVSGTVDTEFPAAATLTDNFANPTTTSVAGMNMLWDGATWDRAPGNSTDGMLVNLGANNDVTITGTVAVTQSGTWILGANSGVDIGDVTINNAGGGSAVNIQDGGNSITVDGTVTADTELPAAAALADATANPTTSIIAAALEVFNGSTWDRVREAVNATNTTGTGILASAILAQFDDTTPTSITENQFGNLRMSANRNLYHVLRDAAGNERGQNVNASNQAAVEAFQLTASSLNAQVVGSVASDSVDAGNPVKVGGQARQTNPTAVADADRVNFTADDVGRQLVQLHNARDLYTSPTTTTISASTSETTILAAGGAGVFHDLTFLSISNTSNTATRVDIRDSTGGTIRFSQLLGPQGGWVLPLNGLAIQAASNNNWTAQCSVSVTDVRFNIIAVKNV